MARKILLADDSVTAQNMGRRILTDAGYEVVTVNNGSAALKKFVEFKPDIIILDVYMPGYGGLEVCQRIKENKDTMRVPVLLSVGKLEPFKPDEARRVRADAYIVKPFEASELLTALTKLEDKIVPQPEPVKPGRFAKAIAAVEEGPVDGFGDAESGWKERLNIPRPASKEVEATPEIAAAIAHESAAAVAEESASTVIPVNITSEEIAAIKAAAAIAAKAEALSSQSDTVPVEPETVSTPDLSPQITAADPQVEEQSPATFASATVSAGATEAVSQIESSVVEDLPARVPEPSEDDRGAATGETGGESPSEAQVVPSATDRVLTSDTEVLAALATLGSASDVGSSANPTEASFQSAVGVELIARASTYSGPRWIAEAVPVSLAESTFILAQEMEKQYAAFAAADAARLTVSGSAVVSETSVVAVAEVHEVDQSPSNSGVQESSFVAEKVATATVSEPQASSQSASPSVEGNAGAFAAAAGASVDAVGSSAVDSPATEAEEPGGDLRESELAAAWNNWKQVRESILGSSAGQSPAATQDPSAPEGPSATQTPSDREDGGGTVESSAMVSSEPLAGGATAENVQPSEPVTAAPDTSVESPVAASEPDSSDSISSIVDHMLAELKPKLMEEIAKKMRAEKR